MAARAQVVRSPNLQRAQHSQNPLRSQLPVDGGSTTRAGDFAFDRPVGLQHLRQQHCSRAVHSRARRHLDRLQIQPAALAPTSENDLQQAIYFLGHLAVDRFRCFFSWAERSASWGSGRGRKRQIFSFTSIKARLRWRNL